MHCCRLLRRFLQPSKGMSRKRFGEMNCSVAQALEVLGDWWTLLIVRESFLGTRRFADFQANLGIAKNILSDRLEHLVEHDILQRVDVGQRGTRYEYRLTEKGRDLLTVVTALRQWADAWVFGEGNEPLLVRNRKTGALLPRVILRDERGKPIDPRDLAVEPGPGASEETLERYRSLEERRG